MRALFCSLLSQQEAIVQALLHEKIPTHLGSTLRILKSRTIFAFPHQSCHYSYEPVILLGSVTVGDTLAA